MNAIDIGFDPGSIRGFYPVKATARRLSEQEQATIVKAIAHGGTAREHAISALAVANGKRVSKVWIITDPVAELVRRAESALENWWENRQETQD